MKMRKNDRISVLTFLYLLFNGKIISFYNQSCVCAMPPSLFMTMAAFLVNPSLNIRKLRIKLEVKLYVGNMSYDTTEDNLRTLFTQAGVVVTVDVIKDRDSGAPKGFAFITMGSQADAQNAITMFNGKEVGGRPLTVNTAKPREERPGGNRSFGGPNNRNNRGGSGGGNRRF